MKRLNSLSLIACAVAGLFALPLAAGQLYYDRNITAYDGDNAITLDQVKDLIVTKYEEVKKQTERVQQELVKGIDEVKVNGGAIKAETATALKELGEGSEKLRDELKGLKDRFLEIEQKLADPAASREEQKLVTAGDAIIESDAYKAMVKSKTFRMEPVEIQRKQIVTGTISTSQPLVNGDRLGGIIGPGLRRFTIRDLMPNIPTTSNLIEFCQELVFTNSAGPQYDTASPGPNTDGANKPQSDITFQLSTTNVITLAHWLGASRQIMADAPALAGYVNSRLSYGLKLEEEGEILTGVGTSGTLNGLNNQATAFSGGGTNQTAIDTLLKAQLQVSLSYFDANGFVLHPTDWANILLLKDTQNRYLYADPHNTNSPKIWGLDVIPTQAQTLGKFTAGAFDLASAIFDREGVSIRMSDQHLDFFTRNLVAILCEERLALAIFRPLAVVYGSIQTPG